MPITNNSLTNGFPVNFQLMRSLLRTARAVAPFYGPAMPGILENNAGTRSVRFQRIENLAAVTTPLADLSGNFAAAAFQTREPVVPTITNVDATVDKYGNAIVLTDSLELMSVNARTAKFMVTIGENAGRSLNHILQSEYNDVTGASIRLANNVGAVNLIITAIQANDIRFSVNRVNREDGLRFFPQITGGDQVTSSTVRPSYIGICHSDVEEDVRQLTNFISSERYGGFVELLPGEFGAVGGVRWVSTSISSLITADAGGTAVTNGLRFTTADTACDVYDSYVLGMEAVGTVGLGEQHATQINRTGDEQPAVELVQHAPETNGIFDLYKELYAVAWRAWFAGLVLNNNWMVRIRTGATAL